MSSSSVTVAGVMSALVGLSAVAGLVVAITNIRKAGIDCGVSSLSTAYIVFFILAVLAAIGAGGAIFKDTELGATAGLTLLTFMSASLFVLGGLIFLKSSKITDLSLRKTNYAVFGIFALLSLLNTGYLFYKHQSIINSQPFGKAVNFFRNGVNGGTRAGGAMAPPVGSPVRV